MTSSEQQLLLTATAELRTLRLLCDRYRTRNEELTAANARLRTQLAVAREAAEDDYEWMSR